MLVVGQLSFVVAALQARQGVEGQADRRRHDEQDRDGRQNLHARRTTTRGVVGRRRGGTASPTLFDRETRPPLPPIFWTEIRAKVSPLLQLVTY